MRGENLLKTIAKRKILKILMPYIVFAVLIFMGFLFFLLLYLSLFMENQASQQAGAGAVVNVNLSETTLQ